MNSNLKIKEMDFQGTKLLTMQNENNGKIYVGVKWFCNEIGLSENQTKYQMRNVNKDLILSKGSNTFRLPTKGGSKNVLCIELECIPIWLAKISITKKNEGILTRIS